MNEHTDKHMTIYVNKLLNVDINLFMKGSLQIKSINKNKSRIGTTNKAGNIET
jgi:hypothetical protein